MEHKAFICRLAFERGHGAVINLKMVETRRVYELRVNHLHTRIGKIGH